MLLALSLLVNADREKSQGQTANFFAGDSSILEERIITPFPGMFMDAITRFRYSAVDLLNKVFRSYNYATSKALVLQV